MPEPLLLIVDSDSARRQQLIRLCLRTRPKLRVVGASTAAEATLLIATRRPQRVAVAVELRPETGLRSAAQSAGAEVIALSFTGSFMGDASNELVQRLTTGLGDSTAPIAKMSQSPVTQLILIGASTGGIAAIETVLSSFPADCPPVLVVQHIRDGFVDGLVRRLDQLLAPDVRAAHDGAILTRGTVHIAARSDRHLGVTLRGGILRMRLLAGGLVAGHCPSVDVLFHEGAALAGQIDVRLALLTGMGADGADGMCAAHAAGAHTIAQDRDTSVVWGMPKAAIERGGAAVVLPLNKIAPALLHDSAVGMPTLYRRGHLA